MSKRALVVRLFGVLLLTIILVRMDLSSVASTIIEVNPWYLALTIVLIVPVIFFKSWRWQYLLKMQGITYPMKQAFLAYFGGLFIGLMTPGRVGEFARTLYLTNDKGMSGGAAFSNVLVDRLFDVYLLFIIGIYGLVAFSLLAEETLLGIIVLALFLPISLLPLRRRVGQRLIDVIFRANVLQRFKKQIQTSFEQFYTGIEGLTSRKLAFPMLLTFAAYACSFSQCYLLALSLNLPLSYVHVAVYTSLAALVVLLPITIFGVGTRDATLIALFSQQGISAESAVSYSLLFLFAFYICAGAMGAIVWQIKPIPSSTG